LREKYEYNSVNKVLFFFYSTVHCSKWGKFFDFYSLLYLWWSANLLKKFFFTLISIKNLKCHVLNVLAHHFHTLRIRWQPFYFIRECISNHLFTTTFPQFTFQCYFESTAPFLSFVLSFFQLRQWLSKLILIICRLLVVAGVIHYLVCMMC